MKSNELSSYIRVCIRACSVITLLKISIHNSYVPRTCQFISLKIEFKKYFRFVSDSVNVVGFTVYFLIIYITYTHAAASYIMYPGTVELYAYLLLNSTCNFTRIYI